MWFIVVVYCCGLLLWFIDVVYCYALLLWFIVVAYRCGLLLWFTVVVYCSGLLTWFTVVVYWRDLLLWFTVLVYCCFMCDRDWWGKCWCWVWWIIEKPYYMKITPLVSGGSQTRSLQIVWPVLQARYTIAPPRHYLYIQNISVNPFGDILTVV